jgi:assimilatory nitrate reductase catalytic subunit
MIYLRAGNSSPEMVVVSVSKDGAPMRLFPIGAKGAIHVPLAVVEDIDPGTTLDLAIAAPAGITGTVVIDFGLVEI